MTASGNLLKITHQTAKIEEGEVVPLSLVKQIPRGVTDLIFDYYFDAGDIDQMEQSIWLKQPAKDYKFFGISSLKKQILTLAEYAGPLDQIETCIRKAHAKQESHLQATLMQAITLAVKGLDQTIRYSIGTKYTKGTELDEGMAERLLTLHAELFPENQAKALEQVKLAAPFEDEKAKNEREEKNVAAMQQLFTAFIQNDKDALPAAINTFNEFVKSIKPKEVTNNRYYLNLLHLIFVALNLLANRGRKLPQIDEEDLGGETGKLAHRFYFEIIGATLESDMPHRVRQILRNGVESLLQEGKKPQRILDVLGTLFQGDGTNYTLGVNFYYDHLEARTEARGSISPYSFKDYYDQLRQQPQARPVNQCRIM